MAVSFESSLPDAEGAGLALPGGKLIDSLRCFPARNGLGIIWTRVEHHPPEPPNLGPDAALLDPDGEVAQGEVAVDALVDAAELLGTAEGENPQPARFGIGRLPRLAVHDGVAEEQFGVGGIE